MAMSGAARCPASKDLELEYCCCKIGGARSEDCSSKYYRDSRVATPSQPVQSQKTSLLLSQFFLAQRRLSRPTRTTSSVADNWQNGAGGGRSAGGRSGICCRGGHRDREDARLPDAICGRASASSSLQERRIAGTTFPERCPVLEALCSATGEAEVCYMKGRNNYLCRPEADRPDPSSPY